MPNKQYTAWAIKGRTRLYYGVELIKNQMIAKHVYALDQVCFNAGRPKSLTGRFALSKDQKIAWKKCRSRGDRAVKVIVSEVQDDQ